LADRLRNVILRYAAPDEVLPARVASRRYAASTFSHPDESQLAGFLERDDVEHAEPRASTEVDLLAPDGSALRRWPLRDPPRPASESVPEHLSSVPGADGEVERIRKLGAGQGAKGGILTTRTRVAACVACPRRRPTPWQEQGASVRRSTV